MPNASVADAEGDLTTFRQLKICLLAGSGSALFELEKPQSSQRAQRGRKAIYSPISVSSVLSVVPKKSDVGHTKMKLFAKSDLVLVGVLGGVGVIVLFNWSAERNRLTPPPTATTLAAFADCMPAPQRLAAIDDAGATKFVWIGDTAKWLTVASGPACYVFDSKGVLLQWDLETHDGRATTRFVGAAWEAKPLTVQEAIDLIDGA